MKRKVAINTVQDVKKKTAENGEVKRTKTAMNMIFNMKNSAKVKTDGEGDGEKKIIQNVKGKMAKKKNEKKGYHKYSTRCEERMAKEMKGDSKGDDEK